MTLTPAQMLSKAIALAAQGHSGQFDKGGFPYILHPMRVMNSVGPDDFELMAIAVMHDLLEDTPLTAEKLLEEGFSQRVVQALKVLTHPKGEDYEVYISRVSASDDTIRVKMADLSDNSDIRRLKGTTQKDFERVQKYQRAYEYLKGVLALRQQTAYGKKS